MFTFWTHGVAVIIEFPERVALLKRAGWGTLVEQAPDPPGLGNNWFHFALHTPTILAERFYDAIPSLLLPAHEGSIRIVADANVNARISEVHLRMGDRIIFNRTVDLRGPRIDYSADIWERGTPRRWPTSGPEAGLALCLRVEFGNGSPRGQITFRSAGVKYPHLNVL